MRAFFCLFAILATGLATASSFHPPAQWGGLSPGEYAVGHTWSLEHDLSRSYFGELTSTGGRTRRPIQIAIWYPARPDSGKPLTFQHYLELAASELSTTSPRIEETMREFRGGPLRPYFRGEPTEAEWRRLLQTEVSARDGADPVDDRFPLLLYGGFGGAIAHSVLFEYLASHGYVVLAVPQLGTSPAWHGRGEWTVEAAEEMVDDLGFALQHAAGLSYTDIDRVGVIGPAAGINGVLLGMRTDAVDAIAAIEALYPTWLRDVPSFDVRALRVPILDVPSGDVRTSDSVFDELRYSDRTRARIEESTHMAYYQFPRIAWASQPASPGERSAHVMASDQDGILLYGGVNDPQTIWKWNGQEWSRLMASHPLGQRAHAAMTVDPLRDELVIQGGVEGRAGGPPGIRFGDTWVFASGGWRKVSEDATGPGVRDHHAMIWDAARGQVILFGGNRTEGDEIVTLNDTWRWDGNQWHLIEATSAPPPRSTHRLAYDSRRERVVLFGGWGENGLLGDTWEWDGTEWHHAASSGPSPRFASRMAYDPDRGVTILYGGRTNANLADTWVWDGLEWKEVAQDSGPGPRNVHAMAWDPIGKQILLYGGIDSGRRFGDTWAWSGEGWRLLDDGSRSAAERIAREHSQYEITAELVRSFLDWKLKGDAGAADLFATESLERRGRDVRLERSAPVPAVPTEGELLTLARQGNLDLLESLIAEAREREPALVLFDEPAMTTVARFLQRDQGPEQAARLFRIILEQYPDSENVRKLLEQAEGQD